MAAPPRKPYLTDLTEDQWSLLPPFIPPAKLGGRPRAVDGRAVLNPLLSLNRTGCQWDRLPYAPLPTSTVYAYFAQGRRDGTWQPSMDARRAEGRTPQAPSKEPTPRAASLVRQSVQTTDQGGERGYAGGKNSMGRKRHVSVAVWGLVWVVVVSSAAIEDAVAVPQGLKHLGRVTYPQLAVMAALGARASVRRAAFGWKHLWPAPLAVGVRIFTLQRVRQRDSAVAICEIFGMELLHPHQVLL